MLISKRLKIRRFSYVILLITIIYSTHNIKQRKILLNGMGADRSMDDSTMKTPAISLATILRTAALAFALTNQACHSLGNPFLPIDDEEIQSFVTISLTVSTSMVAWWHNNPFTKRALHANSYLKKLKSGDTILLHSPSNQNQEDGTHAD